MKKLLILLTLTTIVYSACGQNSKEVPYQVDSRPVPKGKDFNEILPLKVGSFQRVKFTPPKPRFDGEASYRSGNEEIFILFSLSNTLSDLKEVFETIADEVRDEKGNLKIVDIKSGKKCVYLVGKKRTFFAWNRGLYCFSVDGNHVKVDEFMKYFPY